jgi:molybdopterin molybdotransferase
LRSLSGPDECAWLINNMPEFIDLLPPREALKGFMDLIGVRSESEEIETKNSINRVTFKDIIAPHSLPSFSRSTVDGFAVRAADTFGASDSLPIYLNLLGEVEMGSEPDLSISTSQCSLIHTGGMLPEGADSVVMLENTQVVKSDQIEVMRPVAVGENVLEIGEDVKDGEIVIPGGQLLRPAEIGGLLGLGITRILVTRRPSVAIISSGDEVIPPHQSILPGQVRDINSYTLSALVDKLGSIPIAFGIVSDDEEELYSVALRALRECDLVVITAGSSASTRDLTAKVINRLGKPGVISHGVNVRPGKPTILGACVSEGYDYAKPVIGLPGNPVSALVIALLFVEPVIDFLHGMRTPRIRPRVMANLAINLASQSGREDWVPVKLIQEGRSYVADPIFGKSNLIFTLARADGLAYIPSAVTGLNPGDDVEVMLL